MADQQLSQEDLIARLDAWIGREVAVRVVGENRQLIAVFQGRLGRRGHDKGPALFWPLAAATHEPHSETPGVYLHSERFEAAAIREGEFVLELRQAGTILNIRRL